MRTGTGPEYHDEREEGHPKSLHDWYDDRAHTVIAPRPLGARDDDQLVDGVALHDESLLAVEHGSVGTERDRRPHRGRVVRAGVLGDRQ